MTSIVEITDRYYPSSIRLKASYNDKGDVIIQHISQVSGGAVHTIILSPEGVVSLLELLAGAAARVEQIENWAAADAKNECRCYTCNRHVDKPGFCNICAGLRCEQEQITNLQVTPR
jgi:hypothetical protein